MADDIAIVQKSAVEVPFIGPCAPPLQGISVRGEKGGIFETLPDRGNEAGREEEKRTAKEVDTNVEEGDSEDVFPDNNAVGPEKPLDDQVNAK